MRLYGKPKASGVKQCGGTLTLETHARLLYAECGKCGPLPDAWLTTLLPSLTIVRMRVEAST